MKRREFERLQLLLSRLDDVESLCRALGTPQIANDAAMVCRYAEAVRSDLRAFQRDLLGCFEVKSRLPS